jgi:hypothetical protein
MVISAAIIYAVMIAYLLVRGLPARRVLQIVATGIFGGLLLSYTLGLVYFLIVLVKPAETIAVFSIAMLLISAAYFAREQILTSITPVGIIFLNIAANFVDFDGRLPLSLGWLAALIPIPYGLPRIALNLIVLYSPALLALAALRRGPPGDPWVRLVLGAWVCWVGIAALAGPVWNAISQFRADNPMQWLVCIAAAYAAVHVSMLALNLLFVLSGNDDNSARSIARSVRIDHMPVLRALLIGAAFWAGTYVFVGLPLAGQYKAGLAIAAAFVLGSMMKSRPAPDLRVEAEQTSEMASDESTSRDSLQPVKSFKAAGSYLVFLALMGFISFFSWRQQSSRQASWLTKADFTDEDFMVEILLMFFGSVTLMTIVMMACALFEGLSHARARRGILLSATVALFVGYRIVATPLSPAWRATAGDQQSKPVAARQHVGVPGPLGVPRSRELGK